MLSQVLRTVRDEALVEPGQRVLVGLSGGPDSTALLEALVVLAERLGVDAVEAACVDHRLRPESASEAELVATRAAARGVRCVVLEVDVAAARRPHGSLQDAARRARLAALAAHARAVGADRVALGHTADDQAETVLFRVIRGTGVAGLAGIPYRRDPFIRPLLDVRRSEVLRFLARRRLPSLTDPSNADPRFARARLRGQVLPELARENPRVTEALLALGRDARRVLRGDHRVTPGLRAADVVERLVRERAGTRRVRVSGADVEVSYGRARWVRPGDAPAAVVSQVPVAGSGLYRVCDDARAPAVEVALVDGSGPIEGEAAAFDLDAIPEGELVVRPPLPGDRLRPRGGRGSRKLAELLVDAKVPRPLRPTWPVLACGAVVLYVPGLRPSELARPHAGTRRLLVVRGRTGTGPFIDQTGSADNTF